MYSYSHTTIATNIIAPYLLSLLFCISLKLAARYNHAEVIRLLAETGNADVQERNSTTGWVALHEASFRGNIESVKCLLQLNAPLRPRTPAPDENTPRELAVRYKQPAVVDLLGKRYFLHLSYYYYYYYLSLLSDWAAQNYPKPRTTTAEWLHKNFDRNVSIFVVFG